MEYSNYNLFQDEVNDDVDVVPIVADLAEEEEQMAAETVDDEVDTEATPVVENYTEEENLPGQV